ncbi:ABC transporter permease [Carnobacterium gallinarum]|uniref:ABC transporter permease n=1 Tax=Carnobacterium gallinarum TaxID=2749 RepID=UPI0005532502|nr:ABC transporter permease [Carnobacterium gallinarum]
MWLLIKSDFYRYTRGKKWIGLLITLFVISLISIISYYYMPVLLDSISDPNDPALDSQTLEESQEIRREIREGTVPVYLKVAGGNTLWVVLVIILVSVNFLVTDFKSSIFKISFSFGISRWQIYLAKYLFGVLSILLILSFYHLTSLVLSCLLFKIKESFFYYLFRTIQVIIIQLPLLLAVFAVCMGWVYLLKSKLKIYGVIFIGALLLLPIQMKLAEYFPKSINVLDRFKILSNIGKIGNWENHSFDYFASNLIVFVFYSLIFLTIGWISFKKYDVSS